jgi:hypothetical protein
MKKAFAMIACAVVGISSVAALNFSVGAGGEFISLFMSETKLGGGGYVFAEIPYAGLEIGYEGLATYEKQQFVYTENYMYVGVYSKFPFPLSPGFSLFPKLGVNVAIRFIDYYTVLDIMAGVGVDYNFSSLFGYGIFVRAEALFDASIGRESDPGSTYTGLGARIRIAAGYKF